MISDGNAFFCPTYSEAKENSTLYQLSPEYYAKPKFMSTHVNGAIRSSYMFNMRLKSATAGEYRAYSKVTDVKMVDTLCFDYLAPGNDAINGGSETGVPFDADHWSHWPSRGLCSLYTDASGRFVQFTPADFINIVQKLNGDQNGNLWGKQYYYLCNIFQNAK